MHCQLRLNEGPAQQQQEEALLDNGCVASATCVAQGLLPFELDSTHHYVGGTPF
jgi:hypothetical protein